MIESAAQAKTLHALLTSPTRQSPATIEEAKQAVESIGKLCSACHKSYRNG